MRFVQLTAGLLGLLIISSASSAPPLDDRVNEVINHPNYKHARWGILVVDAKSGNVVFERNPEQMFVPASTTKLYSCAAALCELGPDYRFKTRVVARGDIKDGVLQGELILIASGDLTFGGRTLPDGKMAFANSDHTYADATATASKLIDVDPLSGLKDLAASIKRNGINRVTGEVLIDDRLFDQAQGSGSGPTLISPIMVNDNVVDFQITNEPDGIHVQMRPETSYVRFDSQITADDLSAPRVTVMADGPRAVAVRGRMPKTTQQIVRAWPVDDPTAFARCLFIECLRRQGINVVANPLGPPRTTLPDREVMDRLKELAVFESPPFSEAVKVTLKVSHNLYASTMPLLLASRHGQRTLSEGLQRQQQILSKMGFDTKLVSFAGGAGGAPADSTSPRATVELLRLMMQRPEYPAFNAGLPILGVDGTLADSVDVNSPARGRVHAKTGTLVWGDLLNGRSLLRSKALAGTMTTKSGRQLAFACFVNDVPLAPGVTPAREGKILGRLCEIFIDDDH